MQNTAPRLNLHHLHYFWAVANDGNLTRTAKMLRVSQSALSAQIRDLEQQLGAPLFLREARRLVLTEAGQVVLGYAQEIFTTSNELLATLKTGRQRNETLRLGALIHDVGKIGIPDQVLRKPGRLTEEEWVMMRAHTTMGEAILQPVTQLRHLLPLVRWHHERLDGSGYPDGLRGDQIAPLVRILSVADVFEAYTAERPYHPGRPATDGMRLLKEEVTLGHLDGDIVCAFETLMLCQGLIDGDIDEAA